MQVGNNAVFDGQIDNQTYFLLGEVDSVAECEVRYKPLSLLIILLIYFVYLFFKDMTTKIIHLINYISMILIRVK